MSSVTLFFKMFAATVLAIFTAIGSIFVPAQESDICMIAHRGYSGKYPENTALAFEKAAEHGSGGAETDIRRTKDGVYVTSHNAEITLKDGTTMVVEEHTYAELTAQPLKNKKTKDDVYLCTLKEYYEIMQKYNMVCFVELKGDYTDEQIREIFTLGEQVYSLDKIILQSFSFDNLLKARELFPELPLMLTYGTDDTNYEKCFEYGISIDADYSMITEEMIQQFHDRGLLVGAWTCNTYMEISYAKSFDLDFIESDYYA